MNFQIISLVITFWGLIFNSGLKVDLANETKSGIVFQSSDGGKTWNDVSSGLPNKFDARSVFVERDELVLGYDKGIWRKKTSLVSVWEKENFLNETVSRIFPTKNGPLVYSYDAGLLQKIDVTGFWVPVWNEFKGKALFCMLETQQGDIFVGSDAGLFKSVDNGKSWKKVYDAALVFSLAEHDNVIIGGSDIGIIRSSNKGEDWESIIKQDGPTHSVKYLHGSFVAISQGGQWLYGDAPSASANTMRRSNDGGKTWIHMDEQLTPFRYLYKLDDRRSPIRKINDVEHFQNYIFTSIDNGIYRSANFGKTWELVLPSIENTYFDIAICGKVIFAVRVFDGC